MIRSIDIRPIFSQYAYFRLLSGITLQAVVRPVDYMSLTHRSAAAVLTAAWVLSLAICVPMLWHVDMQLCWRNNPAWLEVLSLLCNAFS